MQAVLRGLADVQERGQVNPLIQFVTTRKQVEHILSGYNLTSQESHALPVLIALCDPAAGQVTDADKIKEFAWE